MSYGWIGKVGWEESQRDLENDPQNHLGNIVEEVRKKPKK